MASAPPLPPGFEIESTPSAPLRPLIPRTPAPRYPDEAALSQGRAAAAPYEAPRAAAETRKANADAQAAEDARQRHGLTAEQHNGLQSQYNSLGLLENGINEVDQLYRQNYQGRRTTLGGYLPNIVNPDARQFEAASNRLMSAIASAQGLSAQQQNTPTELRIRFGPMVPSATDDDATIEDKLRALRDLLGTQRRTLAQQLGLRENPGDVERTQAAAVPAGAPIGAAGDGSPPGPTDPNLVQPGEGMGQVGAIPITPNSDPNGQNVVSGEGGTMLTENDRRIAGMATALANSALPPDQAISRINEILRTSGRNLLTPGEEESIRSARRNHTRHPGFSATPSGQSQGNIVSKIGDSPGGAATINYLDTVSYGLPGLFSQDYREGVAAVREAHPVASLIGSLAGGITAPGGPRPGALVGEQMLRGGAQGAAYGFNSTGGSPEGAITGGSLGVIAPAAFRVAGAGVRGAYRGVTGAASGAEALPGAVAAQDLNIPLMPGDVGGPFTRRATSVGAQLPFSTNRITNAYEATNTAAQGARDRVAQTVAGEGREVLGNEAAGQAATRGALDYRTSSRNTVGRAYDRAQELAGDTRITPANAIETLDRNIAELSEVPGGAPAALTDLRQRLQGDFTVSGLRGLRTQLRDDFAMKGLRGSDTERRAMQVIDAVTDDINTGLTQAGRGEAATAYRAADEMHRARVDTLDSVIMPIIGRRGEKSGEEVVRALQQASQGNSQRLERFISALPPEEASDVRATLIGQLGRATNGNQNAATDAFSLGTFLTHYSAMTPSARRTVFGREGTKALNQLAEVADLRRQAGQFANRSNTGAIMGSLFTWGPGMLTAIGSQQAMARLLTSPKLVRFLANMPREPGRVRQYLGRLNVMARTETNPVLAQQFRGLADALQRAANDNIPLPGTVAASTNEGPDNAE